MGHIVEATYENGVLKLQHPLPLQNHEKVRVAVESMAQGPDSLLDIRPVSLGKVLQALEAKEDILGQMLEGRG